MINVLIVDDSEVIRTYLKFILESDPGIKIVGMAENGREAVEMVLEKKPDVVTMDIIMPELNGYEATKRIMEIAPLPIIMVTSSWESFENEMAYKAIEAGALIILQKPAGLEDPCNEKSTAEFVKIVKLMSEVKVVTRKPKYLNKEVLSAYPECEESHQRQRSIKVVAIGSSTGGPLVLKTIFSLLPREYSVPILIVQHIQSGFLYGFAEWLSKTSDFSIKIAEQGMYLEKGNAYIAPEDLHMGVDNKMQIILSENDKENGSRPSVSFLFRSVADIFGENSAGVLLTGMGRDGVEELKRLREKGGITIAQDKESSLIYGMPGLAVEINAAIEVLPPDQIARTLIQIGKSNNKR